MSRLGWGRRTQTFLRTFFSVPFKNLQPSFLAVSSSAVADDSYYLAGAERVFAALMQGDILFEPTYFSVGETF